MMDSGFKEAVARINEETNAKLPNIEGEGADSEYPPLYVVDEDEVIVPEEAVEIADAPVKQP
jgi:hypothetical protein